MLFGPFHARVGIGPKYQVRPLIPAEMVGLFAITSALYRVGLRLRRLLGKQWFVAALPALFVPTPSVSDLFERRFA